MPTLSFMEIPHLILSLVSIAGKVSTEMRRFQFEIHAVHFTLKITKTADFCSNLW